ncbi:MAG: ATP-binding cassette domain-containing protein [Ardenticatenaceae bacterium]|nr:ATP-binding cassette domain-containing protein [Ardenticatenaceae bacterium]
MIFKRNRVGSVVSAINDLGVRPPRPELASGGLSGGNQQKVVLAKWLMARPKVIVFDELQLAVSMLAQKRKIYLRMRENCAARRRASSWPRQTCPNY